MIGDGATDLETFPAAAVSIISFYMIIYCLVNNVIFQLYNVI